MSTAWRVDCGSWSEFVDVAANGKPKGMNMRSSRKEEKQYGDILPWSGAESFDKALALARAGWPEVSDRIEKLSSKIAAVVTSHITKPEVVYGYEGIDYDMGRLLDGEPEHWVNWTESEDTAKGKNTICRILYNMAASWTISTESMIAKGAGIAALVKALDYSGIRAEVTIYSAVRDGDKRKAVVTATVKQSGQDLDFPVFAYSVAHPSTFRRLVFSIEEQAPLDIVESFGFSGHGGYGGPCDCDTEESSAYDIHVGRSFAGEPQWTDEQATITWVLDTLQAQGVTLTQEYA